MKNTHPIQNGELKLQGRMFVKAAFIPVQEMRAVVGFYMDYDLNAYLLLHPAAVCGNIIHLF